MVAMTRFYFHLRDHDSFEMDHEGQEFPRVEDARKEAEAAAREMVAEAVLTNSLIDGKAFEITTENGAVVAVVFFKSVIPQ